MFIMIPIAVLLVAIVAIIYSVGLYNGLIEVSQNVNKAWANIDVLLQQRHDELPKLIAVCEGYKNFERSTLEAVIAARQNCISAGTEHAKVSTAGQLSGAIQGLLAVAESYPDLKSNQNFLQLQSRISALEQQITDRREFYNDCVNTLNIRIQEIPDSFFATMIDLHPRTLYHVPDFDKQDVKVSFAA